MVQDNIQILNTNNEEKNSFRYAMVIEYIGTRFAGSQIQPKADTVQSELLKAVKVLLKTDTKLIFSGRTDRGVNAKGQVVHFDVNHKLDGYRFVNSLNALLPSDISVKLMKEVDKNFHSQKSAKFRWYRYTINNNSYRSVWASNTLHVHEKLNIQEMNKALEFLLGKHDFNSFKKTNSSNPARECIMYKAECAEEAGIIHIDFVANRFLYNMVRIIVGTLLEIGKGKQPAEYMLKVLNAQDRTQAGTTAEPIGLTLIGVGYDEKYDIIQEINKEALSNEDIFCKAS